MSSLIRSPAEQVFAILLVPSFFSIVTCRLLIQHFEHLGVPATDVTCLLLNKSTEFVTSDDHQPVSESSQLGIVSETFNAVGDLG